MLTILALAPLLFGQAGVAPAQRPSIALANVTDPRFAQRCPNAADPLGKLDSTCAVRAAAAWAEGNGIPGGGYPVLYFPHGVYHVAGSGYESAITLTKRVSVQGDGATSSAVIDTSPRGALLTYLEAGNCSGLPGMCPITVQGIAFAGQGSRTAGGLVEIDSTNTGYMRDVTFSDSAGLALNLQGSSERWYFDSMDFINTRWPVVVEGDTNEDYFNRVNVLDGGETQDYCFSVNCPNGKLRQSGPWYPDPHSAVFLDGDNLHWSNSSIKSTNAVGGIRLAPVTSSVSHTYIEGFPWGGQPRSNHAVAAPGPIEIGHLTEAVGTSTLDFSVDDAGWQPLYVNNPAQARINGKHSYVTAFGIFPVDYLEGSQEPSRAVPGITRGTMEWVEAGAFSGDGRVHLLQRAKQAIAWPAGSVIEQASPNGYGVHLIEENHLNSIADNYDQTRYQLMCSDTAQRAPGWTNSPSELCAEVIAGLVPDGYMVPFPPVHYVRQDYSLSLVDNSIFTGGSEPGGEGWLKIPGNANVEIEEADWPPRTFVDRETALHTYSNGQAHVQVIEWPSPNGNKVSALAYVADPSAGVRFSPQEGFYVGDVDHNGTLSVQTVGPRCWYDTPGNSAAPIEHSCVPVGLAAAKAASGLVKYVVRDWQVNRLAPRDASGACVSREVSTGSVHFSTAADATLIVNVSPNPGAAVSAVASVQGNGSSLALRMCNTGDAPVTWQRATLVTVTQLP